MTFSEQPPRDEPAPPDPAPDGDDDGDGGSPFETETIQFAWAEGEVFGVVLDGPAIRTSMPVELLGRFLEKLHYLTQVLAAGIAGARIGSRGPFPAVAGVGKLELSHLDFGHSVTLKFKVGAGEEFRLSLDVPGRDWSAMTEAANELAELLDMAAGRNDDALLAKLRERNPRVGTDLDELLRVLEEHNLRATWTAPAGPKVTTAAITVAQARATLRREDPDEVTEVTLTGVLHKADSLSEEFWMQLDDPAGARIRGKFAEELTDLVGRAWGQHVQVHLRRTSRKLARKSDREQPTYELLDLVVDRSRGDAR